MTLYVPSFATSTLVSMLSEDSKYIHPSPFVKSREPDDFFIVPEILATVGSAGVSTGCGCTVSVKMDVPEFPASSDAVHAIMLVPIGKFVGRYVDVIEVTVLNGSD